MKNKNNLRLIFFTKIISLLFSLFTFSFKKINITSHNGESIFKYPDNEWNLVPYPGQKGLPFNADNLSTVNRHSFANSKKFQESLLASESRWNSSTPPRDISWRLNTFLWAFGQNLNHPDINESIFIECGTGLGYMTSGACKYFNFNESSPALYLIDRYEDSSVTNTKSSETKTKSFDTLAAYTDDVSEVIEYFDMYPTVNILKGLIPKVLEELPSKPILFLHVDLNAHVPEREALEILSIKFVPGTIILFDDYGGPGAYLQADVHEKFAHSNNKNLLILPTGQAMIVW